MSDRYVRPVEDGWSVFKADATRASAHLVTRAEAIDRAAEIVSNDGGGQVIVHGTDDAVLGRRDVPSGAEHPERIAAGLAAATATEGARQTAADATVAVGETADEVGSDAATTAKKVAGHTRHGREQVSEVAAAASRDVADEIDRVDRGDKSAVAAVDDSVDLGREAARQIAEQADATSREAAGEVRGAGRRAATTIEARGREAGEELTESAERAARVGAHAESELRTTADRAGQSIWWATESAAAPLDHLAAALNPVRVTGRVVGAVAVGGLRLAGRVTGRGTDAARRGAERALR